MVQFITEVPLKKGRNDIESLARMDNQSWSFLWTEYEHRRNPKPKSGDNFNKHLIGTYGANFKYCLNEKSSSLLKEVFQTNFNAILREVTDSKCYPIGLVMGAPGVGKTRFLLECVNHLREKYPTLLNNLVDLVVLSYNSGNKPSYLDFVSLGVETSLSLRLLHAVFVNPKRRFDDFVDDLKKAGLDIIHTNILFKNALTIVRCGLGIQSTDEWLVVVAIDEFEKLLSENHNTGCRFLSKLTQTLGDIMCKPPDHTIVMSLMAGTTASTIKSIFRESSHLRTSIPLSPLSMGERAEILLEMNNFPSNWRTCRNFRVSLADVGGLPRLFESFISECQPYINERVPIENWPYNDEIMSAVKRYANARYLAGARPYAIKLIEDALLQTPVCREDVVDSSVNSSITCGHLESQADILLNEGNDDRCIISMPFLLLRWLSSSTTCLKNKAIIHLRRIFEHDGKRITWQEFEEFVAIFEAVKTMLFRQREKRKETETPANIDLADYFNIEQLSQYLRPLKIILPDHDVDTCKSKEKFPKKTRIKNFRTRKQIKWDSPSSPVIVNGAGAPFADVFTVRSIKRFGDDRPENWLICAQCKLYSSSTNLTKTDIENEISKTRENIDKHLSRYSERWLLVIYATRTLDFQIKDKRCIVLDSAGMERHFGQILTERAFYLLEHRKVNVNISDEYELQEVRGVGEKYSSLIVKEREKGAFKDWGDLKRRINKIPKNLMDRFEY